jgi:hypothetical protein
MNLMRWLVLGLLLMSCDSGMYGEGMLTDGRYVGVFLRSDPVAKYQPSNVSVTIEGGRFEGNSSIRNYPAICEGTLRTDGASVDFENECFFTADFDWTLILSGTYRVSQERNTITLVKSYGGGRYDTYTLTRQ